jgi:uncharacterized protein (TIGR02466 family)
VAFIKSGDFTFAFPTLILQRQLTRVEELNAKLAELIQHLAASEQGVSRSNVGAWHSALSLLGRDEPPLVELRTRIARAANEYFAMDQQRTPAEGELVLRMIGWAVVYGNGHYAVPHAHPNANFSGVYYVDAGNEPDAEQPTSGMLSCLDPRANASGLSTDGWRQGTSFEIRPKGGLLVMFPASLLHHVHPYRGTRPRVAVSFNVSVHRAGAGEAGGPAAPASSGDPVTGP